MRRSHKVEQTADDRQSLGAGNLAGQLQHMAARHLPVDVVQDDGGRQQEVEHAAGGHDARRGGHIGGQSSRHGDYLLVRVGALCWGRRDEKEEMLINYNCADSTARMNYKEDPYNYIGFSQICVRYGGRLRQSVLVCHLATELLYMRSRQLAVIIQWTPQ